MRVGIEKLNHAQETQGPSDYPCSQKWKEKGPDKW